MAQWVTASWSTLGWVVLSTVVAYVGMIVYTRIAGLRSFAKMSAFDFAATIAIGSMAASMSVLDSVSIAAGLVGLATLFALQFAVAFLRSRSDGFGDAVDNAPLLLMAGSEILHDHLRIANISEDDLRSKLRESGALRRDQVVAVVFETTGDMTVLKGDERLEAWLVEGVRGADRLDQEVIGEP